MEFKEQKKQVLGIIKQGERQVIAKRAGVTSTTVLNAFSLDTLEGATEKQLRVWEAAIEFVKEKQQRSARLENKVIALAENLG